MVRVVETKYQIWIDRLRDLPARLRPRPNSSDLLLDTTFILLIVAVQSSIISGLIGGHFMAFDLLTPWVVVTAVRQSYARATFLALVGALAWETRIGMPAGTVICTYWILVNIIHFVRELLSWRHLVPWLTTFALTSLAAGLFEWFILGILRATPYVSWWSLLYLVLRIVSAVTFGLLLSYRTYTTDVREVAPQ